MRNLESRVSSARSRGLGQQCSAGSAVAREGTGGPVPPLFFVQKVKTDLYKMLKIKFLSPERFETKTLVLLSSFFNVRRVMHNNIKQPNTKNKPEIELTMNLL